MKDTAIAIGMSAAVTLAVTAAYHFGLLNFIFSGAKR